METTRIEAKLNNIEQILLDQNILTKPILSFAEACRYLSLSESTVYKLTSKKEITHFNPGGKKLAFRREDLDRYLLKNKVSSTDEIEKESTNYINTNKLSS